jgi:hypothetical protein
MKNLYIVVEGQTEQEFVSRILSPYFTSKRLYGNIQAILIRMKGGGHGFNNFEHLRNTIKPLLHYADEPVITTMIDHYGINSNTKIPNYEFCSGKTLVEDRIRCMEQALMDVVQSIKPYRFFIPNIIQHEFETLLLANPRDGFSLETEAIRQDVVALCDEFQNIEEINNTPDGAPSRRLEAIFRSNHQRYEKIVNGVDIAELTGIESMISKCPRFAKWLERVISALQS